MVGVIEFMQDIYVQTTRSLLNLNNVKILYT